MFYPYIVEGGLVWMLPIVTLSYFCVALAMERVYYWIVYFWRTRHRKYFLSDFFQLPFNMGHAFVVTQNSLDPVIQTLHEFLRNYRDFPLHIAERKANQFAEERVAESRQSIDWLSLIANLSGTLGLAGTVVGISISFKSMSLQDSKSLAFSLATALYTTVGGIILFLPSYLCVFSCQKASDHLENDLETSIQNLKDILESQEKSKIIFDKSEIFSHLPTQEQVHPSKIMANDSVPMSAGTSLVFGYGRDHNEDSSVFGPNDEPSQFDVAGEIEGSSKITPPTNDPTNLSLQSKIQEIEKTMANFPNVVQEIGKTNEKNLH